MALMGGRADNELIRTGADTALVEASFELPVHTRQVLLSILEEEALLDEENPNEVTLSRELRSSGRSIARINGRNVSVSLLREVGNHFIDIHGQSDHLSLLDERSHMTLLDRFADNETLINTYQAAYQKMTSLHNELAELLKSEDETAQQKDFLTFQIDEIQNARLSPDEDEELRQERDRLANAEKLAEIIQQSLIILEGGGEETPAAGEMLGQLVHLFRQLSRIDASKSSLQEQVESSVTVLNEVAAELQDYQLQVEYNPHRLTQVEERLNMIHNLKRKYGGSISNILDFAEEAQKKLERLTHADARIAEIRKEKQEIQGLLTEKGLRLSESRQKAASILAQSVERELDDLNMVEARFMVDQRFQPAEDGVPLENGTKVSFDKTGLDRVAFLIAPNPGEGFKPLAKTASGGETSRLMLALKNVLARADYIPTLIFDEIDQGIGGRIGAVVGEKLWQLAREHQVLCVTHLPQLASFSKQHFRVYKEIESGRTYTRAGLLDQPGRIEELSLMLGPASEANRSAAVETLQAAQKRMQELA